MSDPLHRRHPRRWSRPAALALGLAIAVGTAPAALAQDTDEQMFTVEVTNTSTASTFAPTGGDSTAVPLSPGVFAVFDGDDPVFTSGEEASDGLEDIAEDGFPEVMVQALADDSSVSDSGAFMAPGGKVPAVEPGETATFTVTASPGDQLSFATMFVVSNDLFLAPGDDGIELFSDDTPVSGDVTDQVMLWDAGTEVNQDPLTGDATKPNQPSEDFGSDEDGVVQSISDVDDGFEYPSPAEEVIEVSILAMPSGGVETGAGGTAGSDGAPTTTSITLLAVAMLAGGLVLRRRVRA